MRPKPRQQTNHDMTTTRRSPPPGPGGRKERLQGSPGPSSPSAPGRCSPRAASWKGRGMSVVVIAPTSWPL
eukprot:5529365-Pyramimonas_sp.AAC.1